MSDDQTNCKHCKNRWMGGDIECVNGVLIDIDVATEGWQRDVIYPPAPCVATKRGEWPKRDRGCQARLEEWASPCVELHYSVPPDPRDTTIAALRAEVDSIRAEARTLRDLLAKCSDERSRHFDRAEMLRISAQRVRPALAELIAAASRLSIAAQTTGGTAGRDEGLCKAIDLLAPHIEAARAALDEVT